MCAGLLCLSGCFLLGLFSFVCLGLGLFVWYVLSALFFHSPAALSDGDTLWRDCAWEEYSLFLISRHTNSLSCVPEVNVSSISVTNYCILRMCFWECVLVWGFFISPKQFSVTEATGVCYFIGKIVNRAFLKYISKRDEAILRVRVHS